MAPYAAPNYMQAAIMDHTGPGRRPREDKTAIGYQEGLSSVTSKGEDATTHPSGAHSGSEHDRNTASSSSLSKTYARIDDSDAEDSMETGETDDSMSTSSWDSVGDDTRYGMEVDARHESSRSGFESSIPRELFPPNSQRSSTRHSGAPSTESDLLAGGTTTYSKSMGVTSHTASSYAESARRGTATQTSWMSKPPMCTVCKAKPAYRGKNGASYTTCGLTCASKLEDRDEGARTYKSSSSPSSRPGKCIVCKVRDVHVSGRYPTCGLNCAATLKPSATEASRKCELCHKRDKAVSDTGKPYPYCGRACRDKAGGLLEKAAAGTCRTCLVCWSVLGPNPDLPTCGNECYQITLRQAPTMIEIPRGHVLFTKYNDKFNQGWDTSQDEKPKVKHAYYFVQSQPVRGRAEGYRAALQNHSYGQDPVHLDLWISLLRECNTGDSGETDPCHSPTCPFCDVVRNGFQLHRIPGGITLATRSRKADEYLGRLNPIKRTKVMMFLEAFHQAGGPIPEVTKQQIFSSNEEQRRRYPVVKIVEKQHGWSSRLVETGEIHVFEPAAIVPLGCVLYS